MNSILSYVKLEASADNESTKQTLIVKTVFNLQQLLYEIMQMFKAIAFNNRVALELWFNSKVEYLYSDAVSLRTVLNNLISNACKFTTQNGRIDVFVNDISTDQIQIQVKDTGIGIAPEFAPRVFTPFSQQDSNIHRVRVH